MKPFKNIMLLIATYVGFSLHAIAQPPPIPLSITEIFYADPSQQADSLQFVELYSSTPNFDMSDMYFISGIDFHFPAGFILDVGDYVIIAKDSVAFENTFGISAFQWESGSLSSNGDTLWVGNCSTCLTDYVAYSSASPWPAVNGMGQSIVQCNFSLQTGNVPGHLPNYWQPSQNNTGIVVNGTIIYADPGQLPTCMSVGLDEQKEPESITIYPNPATFNITIQSKTPLSHVWLTDLTGRRLTAFRSQNHRWSIDVSGFSSGIYLVEAITEDGKRSVQKVVVH